MVEAVPVIIGKYPTLISVEKTPAFLLEVH